MEVSIGNIVDTVYIKNATVIDALGEYFLIDFDVEETIYGFDRCWIHEKSIIAVRSDQID